MGTGLGAVQEGKTAGAMLRQMLCAGYPAEHALESLNSLCALRERAGAVTVDLVELQLDTGKGTLYKWGAAPSYLVSTVGVEKLGTATPPPGISVNDTAQMTQNLSLRRGQILLLASDGIPEEEAQRCCRENCQSTPEALATHVLTCAQNTGEDDATVVAVTLTGT
jgi:stage II sporulation protein E